SGDGRPALAAHAPGRSPAERVHTRSRRRSRRFVRADARPGRAALHRREVSEAARLALRRPRAEPAGRSPRAGHAAARRHRRRAPADIAGAREFWSRSPTAIPDSWITGPYQVSPIIVNGQLAGGVGVIVVRSWQQAIGGRMIALSILLLIVGTAIAGRFIFGG